MTLMDIASLRPFFSKLESRTCDFTIGGMFMWRDFYKMEFAVKNQAFYSRLYAEDGSIFHNIPISDDVSSSLDNLICLLRREKTPIKFCTVPEPFLPLFQDICTVISVNEQNDYGDYIYWANDLVELKGRKYSGQRNQISQFLRNVHSWSFDEINQDNISEIVTFFTASYLPSAGEGRYEKEENNKVIEVLNHYKSYGMKGGVLRADGEVIGFSLNEQIGDTLFTHVEKASRMFKGAYQMLVNQSAKMFVTSEVRYINREEDMGDLGLRISKKSYHPITILKKYLVEVE